jgi:hypothetical protein
MAFLIHPSISNLRYLFDGLEHSPFELPNAYVFPNALANLERR